MLRKSNFLLYLTLFILLLFLNACSKQEENNTPPATATNAPPSKTDDSASDMIKSPEETMEKQQTAEVGDAPMQENKPAQQDKPATETTSDTQKIANSAPSASSGHEEELALARKSGCLACHAIDKKVVGPPWRDVSKRYLNDPNAKEKLVAKVSKGGRGNWTDVVGPAAMPPYSPRVSNENITKLVEFVLSLEK